MFLKSQKQRYEYNVSSLHDARCTLLLHLSLVISDFCKEWQQMKKPSVQYIFNIVISVCSLSIVFVLFPIITHESLARFVPLVGELVRRMFLV